MALNLYNKNHDFFFSFLLFKSNTLHTLSPLESLICMERLWIQGLQNPTHIFSDSISSRSLLRHTEFSDSFSNPAAQAECCIHWAPTITVKYIYVSSTSLYIFPLQSNNSSTPLLCCLLSLFPTCLLKLLVLIHTGKRKIPSAHTHPYLQHPLQEPWFLSPPSVPSSNIYPIMKHFSMATHDRRVGVGSHMQSSAKECKRESQGHSFEVRTVRKAICKDICFRPCSSLNGLTVYLHITVSTASANNSVEEFQCCY